MVSDKEVMAALAGVKDPEVPLNIVEMGLIYGIKVSGKKVHVKMSLTNPACPMQSHLLSMAEEAVANLVGKENTTIELVWEPAWTPERMTPEARKKVGL